MLKIEQIRARLQVANARAIARATGVHPSTIYRIKAGAGASYDVVKKLSDYFESVEKK